MLRINILGVKCFYHCKVRYYNNRNLITVHAEGNFRRVNIFVGKLTSTKKFLLTKITVFQINEFFTSRKLPAIW